MGERKKFVVIEIPILGNQVRALGTPANLTDKTLKMDLSKRVRGKGLNVTFQIINNEDKLVAYPKKMEITKAYLRRIIRTRTDNVEDSFQADTKDLKITLKPFLITRKKVSRAVRKNLRNTAREFLLEYSRGKTYLEICGDLLEGTVQKEMLPKLKKVYPLAFCDIRVIETKEIKDAKLELPEIKEAASEEVVEENETVEIVKEPTSEDKPKKVTKKAKDVKEEPVELKEEKNANKE
jgi:ribosomal protein S3AE